MNVVINPNEYIETRIYFTDKKANTHIANSIFNRITYSTNDFIMNGIYIQFELFIKQIDQNFNSNIYNCHFDPRHEHNHLMLTIFENIENSILNKWIQLHHQVEPVSKSLPNCDIIQQLRSGVISIWKNNITIYEKPQFQHFIIKISGVWENDVGCGLTYKFI